MPKVEPSRKKVTIWTLKSQVLNKKISSVYAKHNILFSLNQHNNALIINQNKKHRLILTLTPIAVNYISKYWFFIISYCKVLFNRIKIGFRIRD